MWVVTEPLIALLAIFGGLLAVYGIARMVFLAYFTTKQDFIRRYYHGTQSPEDGQ